MPTREQSSPPSFTHERVARAVGKGKVTNDGIESLLVQKIDTGS